MSRKGISDLRYLKALKNVREWLGLSLREAGQLCGVSGQLFNDWQSGHRIMPASAKEKLGEQIADKLTRDLGRIIGIKMETNSPWRITAWSQCKKCRAWFQMRRSRDRLCDECRSKLNQK
jgi:hypothetical protein